MLKLGEQEAKLFISYIENQVEQDVKNENKSIMEKLYFLLPKKIYPNQLTM